MCITIKRGQWVTNSKLLVLLTWNCFHFIFYPLILAITWTLSYNSCPIKEQRTSSSLVLNLPYQTWRKTSIHIDFIIRTSYFPPRSARGPSGGVPGEVIFYFHFSAYQHLRCSLIVPTQNTYICPSPTGGPMAPWGHWPIGPLTLSQPHFEGGVDTWKIKQR